MTNTIIETHNLTKKYDEVTAVDDLNLTIKNGEVFGLLGPNGAGKTTTTLMLLGLTEPTSGSATIQNMDCQRDTIKVKRITGYLPDNVGFYQDMTGRENLWLTGRLNGLPRAECEKRATNLLERVGMTDAADRKTGTYSRGMRQRLGIADVLMKDPKVIIMDEPTLGIDPEGMRELTSLIRRLSTEDGRTILISSHQLYQVQQICDRVGIFVGGRLVACGEIEELGAQLQNEGVYTLEISVSPDDVHALYLIKDIDGVISASRSPSGVIHVEASRYISKEILETVMKEGYVVTGMKSGGGDLDEIYRRFFEKAGELNEDSSHYSGKRKNA